MTTLERAKLLLKLSRDVRKDIGEFIVFLEKFPAHRIRTDEVVTHLKGIMQHSLIILEEAGV